MRCGDVGEPRVCGGGSRDLELEPVGIVLAYDEVGAERGNRHEITKALSSYDGDARGVGFSQVLSALYWQAGCYGDLHRGAFGVSCGDAA